MKILLTILMVLIFALNTYALEIFTSKTVFHKAYDNTTVPLDIVFNNKNSFMVYDALQGKVLDYENGTHKRNYRNNVLIDGNCLVKIGNEFFFCDTKRSRVLKLDKSLNPISEFKTEGKFDPTDIILQKGRYVAVDNDNNRLALFKKRDGKLLGYIGKGCGEEKGCFYYPFTIVQDKSGYTYVSEVMNTRIQVLTDRFRAVSFIGRWGVEAGQLYRPKGLGLLKDKYLIVSDGYIGVLQIFDTDGKFIGVVGDENGNIKRYQSPTRLRVYENYIGVVDPYERIVEIIELGELK